MFNSRGLTVNQWIIVWFLLAIPLVNMILLIIWSFDNVNITLRNYSRAIFKLYAILIGIILALVIALGGKLPNLDNEALTPIFINPFFSTATYIEEKIKFDKVVVTSNLGLTTVSGEVRNYDTTSHSFSFIVTFYDDNKNIIGTADGFISNIGPNQLKTFEAISTNNFSNSKHYRVNIDTIFY